MSRKDRRRKRFIAVMLTAVMLFNTPLMAAEVTESDVYKASDGRMVEAFEINEDDSAVYEDEDYAGLDDADIQKEGGWTCEIPDESIGRTSFGSTIIPDNSGRNNKTVIIESIISITDPIIETMPAIEDGIDFGAERRHNPSLSLNYSGDMSCRSLMVDTDNYLFASENSVTINIGRADFIENDLRWDDGCHSTLDIYVELPTLYDMAYDYGRVVPSPRYSLRGIEKECVKFVLDDGIESIEKTDEIINGKWYFHWAVSMDKTLYCMIHNVATESANIILGDYTVNYYTKIPFNGKRQDALSAIILISDNKTGIHYIADKIKIVRLKNAAVNQGPYPTVSNAGIQITKIHPIGGFGAIQSKSDTKRVQKDIKKKTKVIKKLGWESQPLPLIIYPRRLTTDTGHKPNDKKFHMVASLKGKKGRYVIEYDYGDTTIKLVNGKKDSFKTGVQQIDFDSSTGKISANSADIWTGPYGLPVNRVYDFRTTKDKQENKVDEEKLKPPKGYKY